MRWSVEDRGRTTAQPVDRITPLHLAAALLPSDADRHTARLPSRSSPSSTRSSTSCKAPMPLRISCACADAITDEPTGEFVVRHGLSTHDTVACRDRAQSTCLRECQQIARALLRGSPNHRLAGCQRSEAACTVLSHPLADHALTAERSYREPGSCEIHSRSRD